MKKCIISTIIVLIITPTISISKPNESILKYLPDTNTLKNWRKSGSPEIYHGDDLFLLINGGAEIYHEYGFKTVIAQEFSNRNDKIINLEMYEMVDAASAYGIYSFKTGNSGVNIDIGMEALLEDYYLNFWKGNFVITLIGFDSDKTTLNGIKDIARAIDNNITEKGKLPDLIKLLPTTNLNKLNIKYLEGNLALYNSYVFDSQNIFGLQKGVLCDYESYKLFIFKYENETESLKWYKNAGNHLNASQNFKNFQQLGNNSFSTYDKDNNKITAELIKGHIVIILSKNNINTKLIAKDVKIRILEK